MGENNIEKKDVKTLCRGDVYFMRRNVDGTFYKNTSIALKNNRPFLILSVDSDNRLSRVVTCCPIITREEKETNQIEAVGFIDSRGKHVMVYISQITCIPIEHVKKYAYTVPKDKMDEIDRIVAERLHLRGYIESLVKQYIEDISGMSIGHDIDLDMHVRKEKPLSITNVRDMLRKHNIQLQNIIEQREVKKDNPISDLPIHEHEEDSSNNPIYENDGVRICDIKISHPEEPENVKKYDSVISGELKPKRSTDKKWTYEAMQELVDYYRANGTEKTAEKYNLKKNSLATLLWKAKRKYGINNEKEAGD